jgi:hypothetical protein
MAAVRKHLKANFKSISRSLINSLWDRAASGKDSAIPAQSYQRLPAQDNGGFDERAYRVDWGFR